MAEGGQTTEANLALACVSCSLRKSARLTAVDPETDRKVNIFNPREQVWADHFRWDSVIVTGLTPTGRATVEALKMNRPVVLAIREEEILLDRHPPADIP
jgi:hypothetical protein